MRAKSDFRYAAKKLGFTQACDVLAEVFPADSEAVGIRHSKCSCRKVPRGALPMDLRVNESVRAYEARKRRGCAVHGEQM